MFKIVLFSLYCFRLCACVENFAGVYTPDQSKNKYSCPENRLKLGNEVLYLNYDFPKEILTDLETFNDHADGSRSKIESKNMVTKQKNVYIIFGFGSYGDFSPMLNLCLVSIHSCYDLSLKRKRD